MVGFVSYTWENSGRDSLQDAVLLNFETIMSPLTPFWHGVPAAEVPPPVDKKCRKLHDT